MDAANHRHRTAVDGPQHIGQLARIGAVVLPVVVRHRAHPREVGASAEGFAVAAQHDGAQRGVAGEVCEDLRKFGNHCVIERVAHLRAVEEDAGGGAVALHIKRLHTSCPQMRNTPNFVSGIGALKLALSARASTRRVSAGSMTPSSHRRALAEYGWPWRSY